MFSDFEMTMRNGDSLIMFSFMRQYSIDGPVYFIHAMNEKNKVCYFKMLKKNDRWFVLSETSVPKWISNLESQLSDYIISRDKTGGTPTEFNSVSQ